MNKSLLLLVAALVTVSAHAGQIRNQSNIISGKVSGAGTTGMAEYNDTTLRSLCEQGYTQAIFLYSGAHARTVSCSGGRSIAYSSISFQSLGPIMSKIGGAIGSGGKAIFHCWNGFHATGYVAAATLNHFCGFSGPQAAAYFVRFAGRESLSPKAIASLAQRLSALPSGGQVVSGCPAAR